MASIVRFTTTLTLNPHRNITKKEKRTLFRGCWISLNRCAICSSLRCLRNGLGKLTAYSLFTGLLIKSTFETWISFEPFQIRNYQLNT